VSVSLKRIVFEMFALEKYRHLETQVRGHSRSLETTPFVWLHANFHSNYGSILHRFWDITKLWRRIDGRKSRWTTWKHNNGSTAFHGGIKLLTTDKLYGRVINFYITMHAGQYSAEGLD